ncbi:MAG: hypothetical protein P8R42_00940 [Candidatus Binatia bacterium]|nr:hypothetical protein [Candidatus Binatia bacterium]
MEGSSWKRCNTCKNDIGFSADYYVCSVSTCHRKGTDFTFCTVECWEAHVPLFRHRDSWAEERRSPDRTSAGRGGPAAAVPAAPQTAPPAPAVATPAPPRSLQASPPPPAALAGDELPPLELHDRSEIPEDILVVASKLKAYIRARSGMNTSDGVLPEFSRLLRDLADDAIARAHEAGRKTVMDRDLP